MYWNSDLRIASYSRVHAAAFRPWQSDNIPRRFCSADVLLNDGKLQALHYPIIEGGRLAGIGAEARPGSSVSTCWPGPGRPPIAREQRSAGARGVRNRHSAGAGVIPSWYMACGRNMSTVFPTIASAPRLGSTAT